MDQSVVILNKLKQPAYNSILNPSCELHFSMVEPNNKKF